MSLPPPTDLLGPQTPVADIALALNELERRPALQAAQELDNQRLQALLEIPELRWASAIVLELSSPERLPVLETLAEDRMADLLQDLDHEDQEQILGRLTQPTRTSIMRLMHYPADTAGGIMTTEFLQVPMSWNVAQTLQHIREVESTRETVYAIYVVNDKQQLQFVVPLRKLVCADPQAALTELWSGDSPIAVQALTDKEAVAQLIRRHDFLAIPVVDETQAIIGIVTV
ncbi:MAG: CBS domain-containing protein, partial [Alcaligenes sp.]